MSEEKGVTIEFNGGAIPCVVRNMSNSGVMLDVANAEAVFRGLGRWGSQR